VIQVLVLAVGVGLGFVGSRALRRPQNAAAAASVARNVSGSLGRRRGLTAPELQRACFSEMVRHVQVDRNGRTHAPSRYVLHLHPEDVELIDESRRWFTEGLVGALTEAAREHGWTIDGAVSIDYEADASRRPGVPSALAEPPAGQAPPRAVPTDRLLVERSDTHEQVALEGSTVTLGRSQDRDITVDDNRVSRTHLRFERQKRGWVVIDEGSANGTLVRNARVEAHQPTPIRPGDVVSVGPVELRVAAGSAASSGLGTEPGTRALDDSDRNRISREFLPPDGTAR
jgi:hypothetical protein